MSPVSPQTAVYTGSFDPITLGHLNVIERSAQLFERLIIGVGINVEKQWLFTPEERAELVREVTRAWPHVEVETYAGLTVDFVRRCGSTVMVRGVRPLTDIAAEFTMMLANRELAPEIETVFLMADQRFAHVSSSLLKQIAPLADDERLGRFIPASLIERLRERIRERQSSG